jgi:hypothetical protein
MVVAYPHQVHVLIPGYKPVRENKRGTFIDIEFDPEIIVTNDVFRLIAWVVEPGTVKIRVQFEQPLHVFFCLAQFLAGAHDCNLLAGI